jgi:hypothetical protein
LRKVIIEIPRKYLGEAERSSILETFKILVNFRADSKGFAGVCRITLRDPGRITSTLKGLIGTFGFTRISLISKINERTYLVYIEGKPMKHWVRISSPREGYQYPPFELTSSGWRKTLIGSERQIQRILEKFEKSGLSIKIVWAGEASFSPDTLISSLTESQARTLSAAYSNGYFDFPRRIGSAGLAKSLGLSKSTVSEQLRKSEKLIFSQIFAER